jgi:hypothetical protein
MAKKHIVMTIVFGHDTQKRRLAPVFFAHDRQIPTPPFHDLGDVTKKHASTMYIFGHRNQKSYSVPELFGHR